MLAAQFESFRDPFIMLAGSVPLAISGALLFSFLGFTTLNIYSQVGLITLVGLVSKNGILIVQFANHLQETGETKLGRDHRSGCHAAAPDPDDDGGHRRRSLPAACSRTGPGAGSAQQHRHHAGQRHDHRHRLHAVRRAIDLHARRPDAAGPRGGQAHRRDARSELGRGWYEPQHEHRVITMTRRRFSRTTTSLVALMISFLATNTAAQVDTLAHERPRPPAMVRRWR